MTEPYNEHASSELFKEWGRLAKALAVFKDPKLPTAEKSALFKLAAFYDKAMEAISTSTKTTPKTLIKLMSPKQGGKGGKTIIFERLFSYSELFGYRFYKNEIQIEDSEKFKKYIESTAELLNKYPKTTHYHIDKDKGAFMKALKKEFEIEAWITNAKAKKNLEATSGEKSEKAATTEAKMNMQNSLLSVEVRINEYSKLNAEEFPNAKTAFGRVAFECASKWATEDAKDAKKIITTELYHSIFNQLGKNTNRIIIEGERLAETFSHYFIEEKNIDRIVKDFQPVKDRMNKSMHCCEDDVTPTEAANIEKDTLEFIEQILENALEARSATNKILTKKERETICTQKLREILDSLKSPT